jgi:hypothetical protein
LEHSHEFFKEVPLPLDNGLGSADSGTHLTFEQGLGLGAKMGSTQPNLAYVLQ